MTDSGVLVLNRHWQPIHVTSVRRAFSLLYVGAARAIGPDYSLFDFDSWASLAVVEHERRVIRTVSRVIQIPYVIMLQLYDRIPRAQVRFSRLHIYARDGNRCQYCGVQADRSQLNLDHVIPRSRGGRTTWENVVCCCVPCNLRKAARTPQEAGMRLIRQPVRPRWTPVFRPRGALPEQWLPFLSTTSASYWDTEQVEELEDP
ncbi:MAG: HNH endonuclease [Myxococcales bacterium]|nr:HNH endonuclease [Myxococcota bacterium]MDW8281005.1 HNH endonuclease [Myxococcales bacterium]